MHWQWLLSAWQPLAITLNALQNFGGTAGNNCKEETYETFKYKGSATDKNSNKHGEIKHGGGGGIRTHGTVSRTPVFKTGALNHSATPPQANQPETHCDGE